MSAKESGQCQKRNGLDGPMVITSQHIDLDFLGYVFCISVRTDPEIRLSRALVSPNEATKTCLREMIHPQVVAAIHHRRAASSAVICVA